jgi:hypothetical protein
MSEFDREKAELHGAFRWDCDTCGGENFVGAVSSQLDLQELGRQNLGEPVGDLIALDARPAEDGEHMEAEVLVQRVLFLPPEVTCGGCGRTYGTTVQSEADENGADPL